VRPKLILIFRKSTCIFLNGGTNQLEKNTSISFSVAVADAVIVVAVVAAVVMLAIPDTHATTAQHHWMDGWMGGFHSPRRARREGAVLFPEIFKVVCHGSGCWPLAFPAPLFCTPRLIVAAHHRRLLPPLSSRTFISSSRPIFLPQGWWHFPGLAKLIPLARECQ
jgi:hypothetical protein